MGLAVVFCGDQQCAGLFRFKKGPFREQVKALQIGGVGFLFRVLSLAVCMTKRSAEWMVAFTAYLPTGIFWWVVCSLPFIVFAVFRFNPSGPPPFLVPTPTVARSHLLTLTVFSLFLGIIGSLAIMFSLEISGKYTKATRFSDNTIHSNKGLGKTLSRVLPIAIGIGMGISQANALNAPWWYGALCGWAYPYWMIPSASRMRKQLLQQSRKDGWL